MFLLDGRKVKEVGLENLKSKLAKLDKTLTLAVIQIGNDPASNIYVSNKNKTATKLGCNFIHIKFDETVEEKEVLEKIDELNYDEDIDGILVQMPIPKHLNETLIQNRVKSYKDVLISCTPHGILTLLNYYDIKISKKHVVIVGRSNLVGKPLINLMLNNDATVTVCHSKTENLSDITKTADILIVAVGRPNFIKEDMVKDGAVVVDVGINRVDDKIVGDVDFDSVSKKVSAITPVPGGVGQMTILELFNNLYKAYHLRIQGK